MTNSEIFILKGSGHSIITIDEKAYNKVIKISKKCRKADSNFDGQKFWHPIKEILSNFFFKILIQI